MANSTNEEAQPDSSIPGHLLQQLKGQTFLTEENSPSQIEEAGAAGEQVQTPRKLKKLRKPNNAWNYRSQRDQLAHLVDNPPSKNGQIGTRDISFLHDHEKPLAITAGENGNHDSLLPEEFQIIRSQKVAGLSVRPTQYSTHLTETDPKESLRVFPSLLPNRRFEAKQLDRTFDAMMEELGVSEPEVGPSQMHNLIEIVKKEQNVYDSIFFELIRQVTVGCKERGQLLSKLRKRYADLMARIPRQINSLHQEMIAQRALDRKLTSELTQFKQSIHELTQELSTVKKQDHQLTIEAEKSKGELRVALEDSAKSSAILQEYHQLYELQRQRLEKQIKALTFERDIWNSTAYSLGLKLIEENELTISRRLYVSERSWSKMGNHFAVLISEKDSKNLNELQEQVNKWREIISEFEKQLNNQDELSRKDISEIQNIFNTWHETLTETYVYKDFTGSRRISTPKQTSADKINESFEDLKKSMTLFLQRFGDGDSLILQEHLYKMNELLQSWTDVASMVYGRHRTIKGDNMPQHEVMNTVYDTVLKLHNQLQCQITGENGVTSRIVQVMNEISSWKIKLEKSQSEEIDETEWLQLLDKFESWSEICDLLKTYLGSIIGLETNEKDIKIEETVKQVSNWLYHTVTGIESENGRLAAMLTSIQNDMLKWMSSALLLLVPDKSNNVVLRKIAIPSQVSAVDLCTQQESLSQWCIDLSEYIAKCSDSIVRDQFSQSSDEYTLLDQLKSFQKESLEWEKSSTFLCEALQGQYEEEKKLTKEAMMSQVESEETKVDPPDTKENVAQRSEEINLDDVPLENENHIRGESIFILGENENITQTPVERPPSGNLADPLTSQSQQALQALNTVAKLQEELLTTEERAQTAEMRVEELEDKIRDLERSITHGIPLTVEKETTDVKEVEKNVAPHVPPLQELAPTVSSTTVTSTMSTLSSNDSEAPRRPATAKSKTKKPKKTRPSKQ